MENESQWRAKDIEDFIWVTLSKDYWKGGNACLQFHPEHSDTVIPANGPQVEEIMEVAKYLERKGIVKLPHLAFQDLEIQLTHEGKKQCDKMKEELEKKARESPLGFQSK